MTDSLSGLITQPGKDHKHRLQVVVGGMLENIIVCRRWKCDYREINPNGVEARLMEILKDD